MIRTISKLPLRQFPRNSIIKPQTYSISNYKLPTTTSDISNIIGYIHASDQPTLTIWQKISNFSFSNMYHSLDQFSRELLFTLANDYQLGLPAAVIIISFILRFTFFYPNIKGQVAAMKMKQIKPYMDRFKEQSRIAQMTRNFALMKSAKQQLKQVQRKKGIDNFYALVNVLQIPFLITWFLSLRYVGTMPEVFPSVTQSFLWVPDLSMYDPYFILPILSALLSSYAISISPGLKNAVVMPAIEPFIKYLKFLPILSLPITGFFPGILNLYWCVLAFNQTLLMVAMNTKFVQKNIINTKQTAKPQIMQAVFVQQKSKQQSKTTNQTPQQKQQKSIPHMNINNVNAQKLQILTKKPKKIKTPTQK